MLPNTNVVLFYDTIFRNNAVLLTYPQKQSRNLGLLTINLALLKYSILNIPILVYHSTIKAKSTKISKQNKSYITLNICEKYKRPLYNKDFISFAPIMANKSTWNKMKNNRKALHSDREHKFNSFQLFICLNIYTKSSITRFSQNVCCNSI